MYFIKACLHNSIQYSNVSHTTSAIKQAMQVQHESLQTIVINDFKFYAER